MKLQRSHLDPRFFDNFFVCILKSFGKVAQVAQEDESEPKSSELTV